MKMMHLGVVILSLLLITLITLDTLRNVSFLADTTYLKVQFWCCLFFMADVFVVLIVGVYFCSLTFFVAENGVNPGVTDYWSSLLWSIMSLTTAGCSIHAMTVTGRVLGVVLSAVGLIFFPIFTVFLTNSYTSEQDAGGTTSDKQG